MVLKKSIKSLAFGTAISLLGGVFSSADANTVTQPTPPTLKISGYSLLNLYGIKQEVRMNGKEGSFHLGNDLSDLYFIIEGKSSGGIGYKYQLTFEAVPGANLNVAQNFIELQKGVTVQLGAVPGFERSGLQDASRLLGGAGGWTGGLDRVYNFSEGVLTGYRPIGETKYSTKAVLWTPEYYGARFAFGYTPNTAHIGNMKLNYYPVGVRSPGNNSGIYPHIDHQPFYNPYGLHNMVFGLGYHRVFGQVDMRLSVTGIADHAYVLSRSGVRTTLQETKSYQLGGILTYNGFKFGAGYLDNGRSRLPLDGSLGIDGVPIAGESWQGDSGQAWNVGVSYAMGPYQLALAHQSTSRKTDAVGQSSGDITSATLDLTPIQGLKVYFEGDYVRTNTNASAISTTTTILPKVATTPTRPIGTNNGLIGITGLKIFF